jgi:hypothetical protein
MKFALGLIGALGIIAPTSAAADVVFKLRARIEPQCEVIAVSGAAGSTDITVRTACNVERFQLTVGETGEPAVTTASGQNAFVSAGADGTIAVAVDNPGFQTVQITLDAPLGDELPIISLQTA